MQKYNTVLRNFEVQRRTAVTAHRSSKQLYCCTPLHVSATEPSFSGISGSRGSGPSAVICKSPDKLRKETVL